MNKSISILELMIKDHRKIEDLINDLEEKAKEDFDSMVLHEGDDLQWFTIKEAKELNMYPLDPQILEDLQEIIEK